MDRWKAEMGSQRREEKKKEDQKRESLRRKKIQVREKVGKSRSSEALPFSNGGSKRVRSQLARWEMKNCTPFWREAHFEVNMLKTLKDRITPQVNFFQ